MLGKIRVFNIFPAILKFFESAAATFGETGIADFPFRGKYLSPGGGYRLFDYIGRGAGYSLIALAMVVCAYVEMSMVFTVVPADEFFVCLGESGIIGLRFCDFFVFII